MTLLDIGCGWGATMRRAVEKYDVNVVGLTLSRNQAVAVDTAFRGMNSTRSRRVYLAGWEELREPVDRIVSGRGRRHPIRRGLRALHEVSDRLRQSLP